MADSYNELFGLGSHSEDANLEGWWPMQDDAASAAVDDQSSNGRDGTLQGSDTTDISTTGPNNWLTKSLNLDGSNHYITCGAISDIYAASALTFLSRFSPDVTSRGEIIGVWGIFDGGGGVRKLLLTTGLPSASQKAIYSSNDVANVQGPAADTATYSLGIWYSLGGTCDGADLEIFTDGSSAGTSSVPTGFEVESQVLTFGASEGASYKFNGKLSDISVFSRILSSGEVTQWHNGPELNYVSGVSFGSDGAYDIGTWALPSPFASGSNGSQTQEVIAVNAAGSVLDSDTTATGTLDLSSEAGNTCYLLARVSNAGGYDIGDNGTRTSGYGAAGDGYYEIASVVAAGGGSTPVPVFAHHYRQLTRA
jgi:hypothetical protein